MTNTKDVAQAQSTKDVAQAQTQSTGTELVTKDFLAYNGNGRVTLNNAELIEHTERIKKYAAVMQKGSLGVCYELGVIASKELFKMAGFKSIAQYGEVLFNLKPSTCGLYAQVGAYFIDTDKDNMPVMKDGLPEMQVGALIELLPLVDKETGSLDAIKKALNDGLFGQYSTTKQIRNGVKQAQGKLIEADTKETENEAKEVKETEQETKGTEQAVTVKQVLAMLHSDFERMATAEDFNLLNDEQSRALTNLEQALDTMERAFAK